MTTRRGFLQSLGAAVMAVALDVLPTFEVPKKLIAWEEMMFFQANMVIIQPWRTGILRGFRDSFRPGSLEPAEDAPLAELVLLQSERPSGRATS